MSDAPSVRRQVPSFLVVSRRCLKIMISRRDPEDPPGLLAFLKWKDRKLLFPTLT